MRWLVACCVLIGCREQETIKTTSVTADFHDGEWYADYTIQIELPIGYEHPRLGDHVMFEYPTQTRIDLGLDRSEKANAPCSALLSAPPSDDPETSRIALADGVLSVCTDKINHSVRVVRSIHIRDSGRHLFCLVRGYDLTKKTLDVFTAACRSVTVTGPHLKSLEPEVPQRVSMPTKDGRHIDVKIDVPVGFMPAVSEGRVFWKRPGDSGRLGGPYFEIELKDPERSPPPDGKIYVHESRSVARWVEAGKDLVASCTILLQHASAEQLDQMQRICGSFSATLKN
jgi:hypothetical protein